MTENRSKPPFFIVGAQRSGTTMLRLMINNHQNICVPHETVFITQYFQRLADYGDLSQRPNAVRLLEDIASHPFAQRGQLIGDKDAVLNQEIHSYGDLIGAIFRAYAERVGKTRWGDKTPSYSGDIDILRRIFPDCKVIHLVRDGRDVVLSQKSIRWMSGNLPKLAQDWRWNTTLAHKVGAMLGDDFIEVHYEDLVLSPSHVLEEICVFLDERYDPDMLAYAGKAAEVVPAESLQWHRNSVRPPDPSKLGQWKSLLPRSDRIIFERIAGSTLDLFGYEREHLKPNMASRARDLYYGLIRRY